jgi:hypothetical protein
LTLFAVGCAKGNANLHRNSAEAVVRRLVAAQATSEFGVWVKSNDVLVRPEDVVLEPGPEAGPSLRIVRGIPPRDHWHPYLVAVRDTQAYPLGGFSAPEVLAVSRWVRDSWSGENVVTLARTLALLADDEGAVRSFVASEPSESRNAAVATTWLRIKPSNWPTDTVLGSSAAGRGVRITLLSQQTRSYDLGWKATAFEFQFDPEGILISWSRRIGDKFADPSP